MKEAYADGAVGFLAAVTVAGLDDVRPRVAVGHFLEDESVQIAFHLDVRAARFRHVSDPPPPRHCLNSKSPLIKKGFCC